VELRLVSRSLMGPLRGSILTEGLLVVMVRRTKDNPTTRPSNLEFGPELSFSVCAYSPVFYNALHVKISWVKGSGNFNVKCK